MKPKADASEQLSKYVIRVTEVITTKRINGNHERCAASGERDLFFIIRASLLPEFFSHVHQSLRC